MVVQSLKAVQSQTVAEILKASGRLKGGHQSVLQTHERTQTHVLRLNREPMQSHVRMLSRERKQILEQTLILGASH